MDDTQDSDDNPCNNGTSRISERRQHEKSMMSGLRILLGFWKVIFYDNDMEPTESISSEVPDGHITDSGENPGSNLKCRPTIRREKKTGRRMKEQSLRQAKNKCNKSKQLGRKINVLKHTGNRANKFISMQNRIHRKRSGRCRKSLQESINTQDNTTEQPGVEEYIDQSVEQTIDQIDKKIIISDKIKSQDFIKKHLIKPEDLKQAIDFVGKTYELDQGDEIFNGVNLMKNNGKSIKNARIAESVIRMSELSDWKFFNVKPCITRVYLIPEPPVLSIGSVPWHMLNQERLRLYTFHKYPLRAVKSAIQFAAEGFAYFGTGAHTDDMVICYFCTKTHRGWQRSDVIRDVHQTLSPECAMVTGAACNNVRMTRLFDSHDVDNESSRQASNSFPNQAATIPTDSTTVSTLRNGTGSEQAFNSVSAPAATTFSNQTIGAAASPSTTVSPSNTSGSSITTTTSSSPSQPTPVISGATTTTTSSSTTPPATVISGATSSTSPPATVISGATSTSSSTTVVTEEPSSTNGTSNTTSTGRTRGTGGTGPTYQELSIITERPKRLEFAILDQRLATFNEWPRGHHLQKEDLARAGFYYAGYGDCARCFYCGGGLRNWDENDNVWVEHCRWFPRCAFMRQVRGQVFIDVVLKFKEDGLDEIPLELVLDKLGNTYKEEYHDLFCIPMHADPAVKAVTFLGYQTPRIVQVANTIRESGQTPSSDKILERLIAENEFPSPLEGSEILSRSSDETPDSQTLSELKRKINELREQTVCKMCMDNEVSVIYLPCGHFCACTQCSSAVGTCPVCRENVRGVVRAFLN